MIWRRLVLQICTFFAWASAFTSSIQQKDLISRVRRNVIIEERDFITQELSNVIDLSGYDESLTVPAAAASSAAQREAVADAIVSRKSGMGSQLTTFMKEIFLPAGFPQSVPAEYMNFQVWNIIQDFCSYLRGIMSTTAILEGMGVGNADITPVQATVQWVLRDGASMLGGLFFTSFSSANFGQNIKAWRLFADYINNVGITLDMLAPLNKKLFLPMVCVASVCKALCGIAAGATGSVISEHWGSVSGNTAEVNSKNGAQHTAISLIGLAVSVQFARFARASNRVMWTVYAVLTALHMYANYKAMRLLALRTINIARYDLIVSRLIKLQCFQKYVQNETSPEECAKDIEHAIQSSDDFSFASIARKEPILSLIAPRLGPASSTMTLAEKTVTVKSGLKVSPKMRLWSLLSDILPQIRSSAASIENILGRYKNEQYVIVNSENAEDATVCVCYSQDSSLGDHARGMFEAKVLSSDGVTQDEARRACEDLFPTVWGALESRGWNTQRPLLRTKHAKGYTINTRATPAQ